MSYVDSGAQWRFPIALQVFFALSTIAIVSFLPEAPRWLLSHDRDDEAEEILARIHAHEDQTVIERERLEIIAAIAEERAAQQIVGQKGWACSILFRRRSLRLSFSPISTIFTNGEQRFFYRTMLGVAGMIMQQLTGINLITYAQYILFVERDLTQ